MESQRTKREWLQWLTRVRLLMIVLMLVMGLVWPQYSTGQSASRLFLSIVFFWLTLALLELILVRWIPDASWQGGLQVACDTILISGVVYATGLQDSYFISLYLLLIIVASILFSRQGTFLTAGASLVFLSALEILAFLPEKFRGGCDARFKRRYRRVVALRTDLDFWPSRTWRACFPVFCAAKERNSTQNAKNCWSCRTSREDIIHSMRGGLLTTDVEGRIVVLNRTGEEILGKRFP